ncbi:MAG: hypothetical protein GF311_26370 [Candidatus Lokiarchaeota archaeon]|nr:hypothetical protein [Candidatus Lokiarchaeota archaeon]
MFQSLTSVELKDIFRAHDIKGYSKLTKADLIELLILNLSKEEKVEWLGQNEPEIIDRELQNAINILFNRADETLTDLAIVNEARHEIEATFKGRN